MVEVDWNWLIAPFYSPAPLTLMLLEAILQETFLQKIGRNLAVLDEVFFDWACIIAVRCPSKMALAVEVRDVQAKAPHSVLEHGVGSARYLPSDSLHYASNRSVIAHNISELIIGNVIVSLASRWAFWMMFPNILLNRFEAPRVSGVEAK